MNALFLSLHFNPVKSHSSSIKGKEYRKKVLDAYDIEEDATHMHGMAMGNLGRELNLGFLYSRFVPIKKKNKSMNVRNLRALIKE